MDGVKDGFIGDAMMTLLRKWRCYGLKLPPAREEGTKVAVEALRLEPGRIILQVYPDNLLHQ